MLKVDGIVLKEVNIKEHDKLTTLFTKEFGKMEFYVTRARNNSSPFSDISYVGTYCEFIYNTKNNISFLNQFKTIEDFEGIKRNDKKLSYMRYFMEFLDKTIELDVIQEDIFEFALIVINKMDQSDYNLRLLKCIYELGMLSLLGYKPETKGCICCEKVKNDFEWYFSIKDGGLLCGDCVERNSKIKNSLNVNETNNIVKISNATINAMNYILFTDIERIFMFKVDSFILKELEITTINLVNINIGQNFRMLDFLKNI